VKRAWFRATPLQAAIHTVVLLAANAALLRVMAERDLVSKVFAAGGHLPAGTILAIVVFFAVRLTVMVALPGLLLAHAWLWAVEWAGRRRR
jgi:uncharacterized membrane protein YqgA involved in biofilm formation